MNDTFIEISFNYTKELKEIKNKNFYLKNIEEKGLFLTTDNYFDYEKSIDKLILEVIDYIHKFKRKFKDTYQLHKKEYQNFNNLRTIIFNTPKTDLILTWQNIKNLHNEYKNLAEKCVSNNVYENKSFGSAIRIKGL